MIDIDSIRYMHRGMAFDASGREIGYVIVLKCHEIVGCNGWDCYIVFSEDSHNCVEKRAQGNWNEPKVAPNGRLYRFTFQDLFGKPVYVE